MLMSVKLLISEKNNDNALTGNNAEGLKVLTAESDRYKARIQTSAWLLHSELW